MSKIEVPVALFVGTFDKLATPGDARELRDILKNSGNSLVHYEELGIGHYGFVANLTMVHAGVKRDERIVNLKVLICV